MATSPNRVRQHALGAVAFSIIVGLTACLQPADRVCEPGENQRCVCPGGEGVQTCEDDGEEWTACSCGVASGGGNPGQSSAASTNLPSEVSLPIQYIPQACNEWCWAAGVTMIATYYGLAASECGLASAYSGFQYNCCVQDACAYPECNHGAGTAQAVSAAFQFVGVHGEYTPGQLGELEVATELAAGRPLLIAFMGPFVSHVAIISGYSTSTGVRLFHVMDPWFGIVDIDYQRLRTEGPDGLSPISDTWYNLHP